VGVGMNELLVTMVDDADLIKEYVSQPEIWERVSEPDINKIIWTPLIDERNIWLSVKSSEEVCCLMSLNKSEANSVITLHPMIMKKYYRLSRDIMKSVFIWMLEHISSRINKYEVTIPCCFNMTINGALKIGFTEEGVSRASWWDGDMYHDRMRLGMTRSELEAICLR
jgi:hypothetical protein